LETQQLIIDLFSNHIGLIHRFVPIITGLQGWLPEVF